MTHRNGRAVQIPLIVRVEVEADYVDETWLAAKFGMGAASQHVIDLELADTKLPGRAHFLPLVIFGCDMDQRFGPDEAAVWIRVAHCADARDRRLDQVLLEPA